jgi:uncharacterized protein (DUF2141 family)
MNKNLLKLLMVCIVFSITTGVQAQQSGTLTIQATNFENENGKVVANLFREQDEIPEHPFMIMKSTVKNGLGELIFNNLPNGTYAAIVYHDENDNGTVDHKFGFPNEPMGFSNDWDLSLFSGMPTFRKLRFEHRGSRTQIEVKVE